MENYDELEQQFMRLSENAEEESFMICLISSAFLVRLILMF